MVTGFKVLDEKLSGFFGRGKNILVFGPPMSGKKFFSKTFVYRGLLNGEACIFTCTNNTAEGESRQFTEFGYRVGEFEEEGLLVYVDFYSKTVGLKCEEKKHVRYVSSMMDLTGYNVAVRDLTAKFWREEKPVRLVFDSVTPLLLYNEPRTVMRFLHILFGRLKSLNIISLFLIEEGMHSSEVIVTLTSMVDGVIETKNEDGKHYVRIKSEASDSGWVSLA